MRTARADQRAGDDQQVVDEHEARGRRRPAGVAVQHRDDDRHVAAADRRHQVEAEQQRDDRHDDERQHAVGDRRDCRKRPPNQSTAASAPRLSTWRPGSISGLPPIRAESLTNATIDPVNVTAPMNTPMKISAGWIVRSAPWQVRRPRPDRCRWRSADQHRGQADEAVQHRDQLGHPGHLDHARRAQADRARRSPWRRRSAPMPAAVHARVRTPSRAARCAMPSDAVQVAAPRRSRAWTARRGSG